ncbi:MAG: hypothetical protein ACE14V_14770 [bacterium]
MKNKFRIIQKGLNQIKVAISVFGLFVLFPQLGLANIPILPVTDIMGYPFLMAFSSFGITLIAVIIIEAVVLKRCSQLDYQESIKISAMANGFSTLIGGGIVITYSSSFAAMLFLFIGAYIFMVMFKSFSDNIEFLDRFGKKKALSYISFLVLGIIAYILGILAFPLYTISGHHFFGGIPLSTTGKIFISIPSMIILYLIGFGLSVISEGFIINRHFPGQEQNSLFTVLIMNGVSYLALLLYFIPFLIIRMNYYG